jgi:hypothetical protein
VKLKLFQGCRKKYHKLSLLALVLSLSFVSYFASAEIQATYAVKISIVEGDSFTAGDTFHTITEIRNSKAEGRVDVVLTYEILTENGHMVSTKATTVAVETLSSFSENLKIPENVDEGFYILKATVTSLDGTEECFTSISFSVSKKVTEEEQRFIEFILLGGLIVTIIALLFEHRRISKLKVSGNDLKRFVVEKNKK